MYSSIFYCILAFQITSGVLLTIMVKLQCKQKIEDKMFQHSYMQAQISFIGQMFNFLIYWYQKQKKQESEVQTIPYIKLFLTAIFHTLCQITGFASYYNLQASISMMIGGLLPAITVLIYRFSLGTSINKYQELGIIFMSAGTTFLGKMLFSKYK